ncbi:MAG: glycerol-3-phosphate dehydrogenase/oxidase [Actinobacteria bacterium]|nr:glycerol-3-phosphate dehydrogenase/oxidase [Actinomycetota bacterium]
MTWGVAERSRALDRLAHDHFDVVVVGGGITGAGVLLDAATRGLRVALVERGDFASGTSSRSSKLVHGGLRYLEQREFRLVYEALAERQVLLRNAPHLVTPQPFLFPLFAKGEGQARRQAAQAFARAIGTALWLYDMTGGLRIGKRHRRVRTAKALELFPALDPDRLAASYLYYDARADDARLTLAIVQTAVHRFGAPAANYTAAVGVEKTARGISGLRVRDELGGRELTIRAPVIVNAAGVWADEVRALDEGANPRTLRPAKGVHVTVPRSRLPVNVGVVLPVPGDRRSIFVIPWDDRVYVGTTDSDYTGPLDEPVCTGEEVDYLLSAVNASVRDPLTPADVLGTWAGLRPLMKDAAGERTADLSRQHSVKVSASGVVTVTGGKLTTYRRMAEDTVEAAFEVLGRKASRPETKHLPLHGAEGVDAVRGAQAARRLGVDETLLEHLTSRFGAHARAVAKLATDRADLAEPLVPGLPYLKAEAVYAVRWEMAMTLEDVLARRTRALLLDREATAAAAPAVAALVGGELHWDAAEQERQVERFSQLLHHLRTGAADKQEV